MSTTQTPPLAGPTRRVDDSLVGRLNVEWDQLRIDPHTAATVTSWAAREAALAGCRTLVDVETTVTTSGRDRADQILLSLLCMGQEGDALATRTVVQLMLGKAVRIAASHTGRAPRDDLESAAVAALWTVVATYPTSRRPVKVAANIAMDTLHQTVAELGYQRHEIAADPYSLHPAGGDSADGPADLELLNLLAWAVAAGAITSDEATLVMDVYVPAPGETGGADAAARHELTWAAARQRCSRAVRRITQAIHTDTAAT